MWTDLVERLAAGGLHGAEQHAVVPPFAVSPRNDARGQAAPHHDLTAAELPEANRGDERERAPRHEPGLGDGAAQVISATRGV